MEPTTILLIEDDIMILKTNKKALELQGYRVLCANTLIKGSILMEHEIPDLVILDVLLPDGNGLDYCAALQGKRNVPILFLSALGTSGHILAGLRAGGDDYIAKPYDMDLFLAKVEALLRRTSMLRNYKNASLCMGDLRLDLSLRRAYVNEKDILLKPREFALLEILMKQNGKPIPAVELYQRVWGLGSEGDVRTIWVHISTLRSKLGNPEEKETPYLLSSRNNGYFLSLGDI